jgi:hypothetical protein
MEVERPGRIAISSRDGYAFHPVDLKEKGAPGFPEAPLRNPAAGIGS